MQTSDVIALVSAGIAALSFIGAVVAIGQSRAANRLARDSNTLASTSNDIAGRSEQHAADAVAEAQAANDLSAKALGVAERGHAQATEQWLVELVGEWVPSDESIHIRNIGRDPAHRVTVRVIGDEIEDVHDFMEDLPRGEILEFPVPDFRARQVERDAANDRTRREMRAAGIIWGRGAHKETVAVHVHWLTGAGLPREQTLDVTLR